MKTIFDHIEHVKGKPHHIRKRVAFAAAACGTALIGLVWLTTSLSTGAFAIRDTSFADSTGQGVVVTTSSDTSASQLAGAGAASIFGTDASVPAHIEIVDVASSTPKKQAEQTTIPF
ncbi:MAG: hypothetical protein WA058_02160 [Minisyncoccia bacterium]